MLTMLAAALIVLTSATASQAREAHAARNGRAFWAWLAISLPFLMITLAAVCILVCEPKLLWWVPPTGFGVDWRCQENVPESVSVCFRQ